MCGSKLAGSLICFALFSGTALQAQLERDVSSDNQRARVMGREHSRADEEARELVALSADKIISLLRQETGLLLEAKRVLVKKAYEQGRLLDPEDLTDDALFQLVRDDARVRVLITHEIESRYYVRPKPTRDELERGLVLEPPVPPDKSGTPVDSQRKSVSQEDAYWSKHERALEHHPEPQLNDGSSTTGPMVQPPPNAAAEPRMPQDSRPRDSRRQVDRADWPQSQDEPYNSAPSDTPRMPKVRPQDLPQLLSASAAYGNYTELDAKFSHPGRSALPSIPSLESLAPLTPDSSDVDRQSSVGDIRRPQRPDQPVLRHRPNPYSDVPSLYDLYSQYWNRSPGLQRFGIDVFRNGTGNFDDLPMDLPVGPEYVLGPGDGLSIELWGGISQRLQRLVDRQGRLALPEVGAVEVAGRSLGEVQHLVQGVLRTQFRDVQADISLSRLRAVRVYVVGDVERPGAYDVSSLSTPLNAVYLAGGPTARGSLRILQHYRGQQLLEQIDVYDLLLHGIRSGLEGIQPGDAIRVPPLGSEVTVEGMVRRPALYELNGEKSLAEVLELAGGVLQSGTLRHVDVERVQAHLSRTMLRLDIPEDNNQDAVTKALEDFQVQDGDKIKISPILPYADKTVYLDGHVFRPGKFAYREGMKVTDIIKSYHELLPEPYRRHAEIIRLTPPDYTPAVLAFNLEDALSGKDQDLVLKPFDTVRVFGRFDFEDQPLITVNGEVRDPGDHLTNGTTYLRDAVYLAGGTTRDAQLSDAQIFRRTENGKLKVISVDLSKALAGDEKDNILLEPKDRIFIHKSQAKADPPTVKVEGEVARPGKYPLGDGMSAADLVRVAGGFKRGAYTELADLTRYEVEDGSNIAGEHMTVPIAKALAGQPDTDVRLHDGDVLAVRQIAGWNDLGSVITVKGEVLHPGGYGIKEGERLSSILARAGGFRGDAYPYGAVFERVQVRELEERNRAELLRQVQDEGFALKSTPEKDPDDKSVKEASLLQWKTVTERLQNTPPNGRLVIHISKDVNRWANTPADIEVRAGDVIYIPKKPSLVMVDGAVYNPTAVSFKPGRSAGWYLRQAGGPSNMANKKAIFVIRADGSVIGGSGGLFNGSAESAELRAGDMVVVPEKAFSGTTRWRNVLQTSQLIQAVAFSIQLGRTF